MQLLFYRRFLAVFVQVHKGNFRSKQYFFGVGSHFLAEDFYQVLHRGSAEPGLGYFEPEYFSQADRMVELDAVQRDGDKAIVGVLYARRYISELINPLEQVAAKQRALIIHVFRLYELTMVHIFRLALSQQAGRKIILSRCGQSTLRACQKGV